MRTWRKKQLRRGLSLAEVVVSTLLIGLLMTAALTSVGAAARSATSAADGSAALALARQLLEEITVLPYEDPGQTPTFGLESGEAFSGGARTQADDLDDFKDFSDSPPKDRSGAALAGYTGWARIADVEKVNVSDKSTLADGSTDSGMRRVVVTVTAPGGKSYALTAHRTKDAGSLQPQGVDQTLVTWAGVTLQSGGGGTVTGGISLINHATDQ